MGIFDGHFTDRDWNGDGKVDSWDDVYFLNMVQMQVEDEMREERIDTIVRAITADGESKHIGNEEFEEICRENYLSVSEFTQADIDEIQRRLDRW